MMTVSCQKVWNVIAKVREQVGDPLASELEDAFCDFECGWKEHAEEYHTDKK